MSHAALEIKWGWAEHVVRLDKIAECLQHIYGIHGSRIPDRPATSLTEDMDKQSGNLWPRTGTTGRKEGQDWVEVQLSYVSELF